MADTIGHYHVIERLGSGSLGEVIRARDTKLGRTVTIKFVGDDIAQDPRRRDAFLADARASTALSHPSIAALFDIGEHDGRPFVVFEFVPGTTLRAFMGDRPLNPKRALDLAAQIADALADGHAHNLVHGDVNPETIMVTPTGRAKLLDYGLFRWTDGGRARSDAATAEAEGRMLSSLAYMSPEQALGGEADRRSDVFSLGIVLYEMLTGVSPFADPGGESTVVQVLQRTLRPASSRNGRVPAALDAVLERALMKSLERREPSAAALSADLKAVRASLEDQEADVSEPAAATPRRSIRWGRFLLLLLLLAIVAFGIWYLGDEASRLWRELVAPADPSVSVPSLIRPPADWPAA